MINCLGWKLVKAGNLLMLLKPCARNGFQYRERKVHEMNVSEPERS